MAIQDNRPAGRPEDTSNTMMLFTILAILAVIVLGYLIYAQMHYNKTGTFTPRGEDTAGGSSTSTPSETANPNANMPSGNTAGAPASTPMNTANPPGETSNPASTAPAPSGGSSSDNGATGGTRIPGQNTTPDANTGAGGTQQ